MLLLVAATAEAAFHLTLVEAADTAMEPALSAHSLAIVEHVTPTEVHVGDIVSYVPPGTTGRAVNRRVVAISEDGTLTTAADRPTQPQTQHVPAAAIEGRYLASIPRSARYWLFYALLMPVVLVLAFSIFPADARRKAASLWRWSQQLKAARTALFDASPVTKRMTRT